MDCSDIIESLDTLWFYSSVVSSSPSRIELSGHAFNEDEAVKEEASKPFNQMEEGKSSKESPSAENLVSKCPKCGEFDKEMDEFVKLAEEKKKKKSSGGSNDTTTSSSSGRRRRRRSSNKKSLRKTTGELDYNFGFDYYGNYMDLWLLDDGDDEEIKSINEQHYNDHVLGSEYDYIYMKVNWKMPPLDDNMAMKEHLRSWAYAVACTVR